MPEGLANLKREPDCQGWVVDEWVVGLVGFISGKENKLSQRSGGWAELDKKFAFGLKWLQVKSYPPEPDSNVW